MVNESGTQFCKPGKLGLRAAGKVLEDASSVTVVRVCYYNSRAALGGGLWCPEFQLLPKRHLCDPEHLWRIRIRLEPLSKGVAVRWCSEYKKHHLRISYIGIPFVAQH